MTKAKTSTGNRTEKRSKFRAKIKIPKHLLGLKKYLLKQLPSKPYCTDDHTFGLKIFKLADALTHRSIQLNRPNRIKFLSLDLDYDAYNFWERRDLPPPNWICLNKESGHAHATYWIDDVVISDPKRKRIFKYLAVVQASLTRKAGADPSYSNLTTKNPLHPFWLTHFIHQKIYTLGDLAAYLDLSQGTKKSDLITTGYGRNCTLFDELRKWAYINIKRFYRARFAYDRWEDEVLNVAESKNAHFADPLGSSEVRGIARSVAKYVWRNFDPNASNQNCNRGRDNHGVTRHHDYDPDSGLYLPTREKLPEDIVRERRQQAAIHTSEQRKQQTQLLIIDAVSELKNSAEKITALKLAAVTGLNRATIYGHKGLWQ